jgi:hypothetical protein
MKGETEAGVKLSNKDVVEVLESIMDSLSPIPSHSLLQIKDQKDKGFFMPG